VFENLVKAGVIDPTKVTRTALQNAADCRPAQHRSTGCRDSWAEAAPAGGHGGGGMDGMY
jgi:chaperonin GroEL